MTDITFSTATEVKHFNYDSESQFFLASDHVYALDLAVFNLDDFLDETSMECLIVPSPSTPSVETSENSIMPEEKSLVDLASQPNQAHDIIPTAKAIDCNEKMNGESLQSSNAAVIESPNSIVVFDYDTKETPSVRGLITEHGNEVVIAKPEARSPSSDKSIIDAPTEMEQASSISTRSSPSPLEPVGKNESDCAARANIPLPEAPQDEGSKQSNTLAPNTSVNNWTKPEGESAKQALPVDNNAHSVSQFCIGLKHRAQTAKIYREELRIAFDEFRQWGVGVLEDDDLNNIDALNILKKAKLFNLSPWPLTSFNLDTEGVADQIGGTEAVSKAVKVIDLTGDDTYSPMVVERTKSKKRKKPSSQDKEGRTRGKRQRSNDLTSSYPKRPRQMLKSVLINTDSPYSEDIHPMDEEIRE
jgi:hypothetical protein